LKEKRPAERDTPKYDSVRGVKSIKSQKSSKRSRFYLPKGKYTGEKKKVNKGIEPKFKFHGPRAKEA